MTKVSYTKANSCMVPKNTDSSLRRLIPKAKKAAKFVLEAPIVAAKRIVGGANDFLPKKSKK